MTTLTAERDPVDVVNDAVACEGWAIFDCSGSLNGPVQIQKNDTPDWDPENGYAPAPGTPDQWPDDQTVWMHILSRAAAGSPLHQTALDAVAVFNPTEAKAILEWSSTHQLPPTTN